MAKGLKLITNGDDATTLTQAQQEQAAEERITWPEIGCIGTS
ncbi:predicted protein [Sclerotinia sclerotiorum 1980 UF-70]|uniref:Uncharacterized protein n=1 Tax=Sclerotinia sclerotiorum (strain ATCC 18683 / 1980 / Ss-1) TaxID=665079 RepID=A7ES01_SCLS1|nr:predicted protein [Sclerotinia sclerotiorum 1980 UF-70]EDN92243.1 predicted protein [Sclerotinia sclerotiorum 1980 UF-70]